MDDRARTDSRPRKPALRLPRIPLPAKLLLSYLLLLALAAVPNFFYVRARLERQLVSEAERELLETARNSAGVLGPLDEAARASRARDLAMMTGQRVTLIAASGAVLMDSETAPGQPLAPKSDRPEVLAAAAKGSAVARRVSSTTGQETLYAAVRLPVARDDDGVSVIRVGRALASVRASTDQLTRFARNIQAAAISVALLLSLFAAVQFVRPLQRVIAAARALGAGDLAARSGVDSDDEVGDAGRALDAMAVEIRRRLASAGSGDAVLSQLVDALPVAVVIFEVTGEVLALNGAARSAFRIEGPNASRRLKEITASPGFARALEHAEGDGEPEALQIHVAGGLVHGSVHVVKRPGTAPLYVLLGEGGARPTTTVLPPFADVRPRPLADVLRDAAQESTASAAAHRVALDIGEVPDVAVVEVGERVHQALVAVFVGCAQAWSGPHGVAPAGGPKDILVVDVKEEATRVRLTLPVDPGADVIHTARARLEPLGGAVEVEGERSTSLWIPRA